jgi:predicted phosphodiesterase
MREVVLEYIQKYTTLSKKKIAKELFKDRPDLFISLENARKRVRWYMGSDGERSRHNSVNVPLLPPEESRDYSPYVLPVVNNKILVLSDVHAPFHDNNAISLAVNYGNYVGVNTVVLNGDIMDGYAGSKFLKDPRRVDWKAEIGYTKQFLQWLMSELPEAKIVYKIGNHDDRVEIYMMQNAPLLFQTDLFHVEDLLGLPELGIDCVKDKRIIKAGSLPILHGHELGMRSGGVNPSRSLYLYTHKSALIGHFHRTSSHTEPNLDKKVVTCWSTGCLCNLYADYDPYNKWNHGFAIVETDGELFQVENMRIINGKVVH